MTDERATERLVRAREYTDERGRATAEVVAEPYAEGDDLRVPIEVLTTGERHVLAFRLPQTWGESAPVVRFVESVGYGPGGLDMLVGERFPVDLGDETPEPVLDSADDDERGISGSGNGSAEAVSGRITGVAVGAGRLAGRAAVYAVLLGAFAVHVSVGALVAAAVTSAIVFGGFLIATAFGWLGAAGTLGALLGLGALGALAATRRAKANRRWNGVANGAGPRTRPELFRDR
ncbi:hypothetical protein [Halorubrum sp. DTA46]|uniref:hypothetical protein n=1 Tax=Halorubrum sp. DTA46 TaxID=3402162 RepID=UPI003AAC5ACD